MVTTRPPKTIVKPTALGPVANTDTKLLIYGLFQKGRVLAQDGVARGATIVDVVVRAESVEARVRIGREMPVTEVLPFSHHRVIDVSFGSSTPNIV